MTKILLATTISDYKDYSLFGLNWLKKIQNLNYPNYDIVLVDNSKDMGHVKEVIEALKFFKKGSATVFYTPPNNRPAREYMVHGDNLIRDIVLKDGYTHLMSIECDNFPKKSVIGDLLQHNMPVVGYTYFIGVGKESRLCMQKVSAVKVGGAFSINNDVVHPFDSFHFIDGNLKRVHGMGKGCLLIDRTTLLNIPFRIDKQDEEGFSDTYFFQDCYTRQVPVFCDTSYICPHKNQDWSFIKENY